MFTPPSIPEGEREEWADYAWELWAAEGKSTRLIAEQLFAERGIRISHKTVWQLVNEGRERCELPTRSQAALQVHTAARHLIAKLYEERRAGGASTVDIAPSVLRALERLARLHGTDAPTRVELPGAAGMPAPDPVLAAQLAALAAEADRQVEQARNGEAP